MQTEPRISVVVPTYNLARFVCAAVDSALEQTLAPLEVIVIDDGSTDDTQAVLRKYEGVENVRVVLKPNGGVSTARNHGAALAKGELIAFLDADDIWLPRKLALQADLFAADDALGLVHCGAQDIDVDGNPLAVHVEGMAGDVALDMLRFERPVILFSGSTALLPRQVFYDVGGFDVRLSTSADWDLNYRIASRWRVGFVAQPLLQYRLHGSNMHGNIKVMRADMLLAYEKAFLEAGPELQRERRRCYGRLHMVLAGSFYAAGQKAQAVRHALLSVSLGPENIVRLLGFPLRRMKY
jgi:glycosyltransferase involved in cell wall biosynthesis